MNVSDYIIDILTKNGVDTVFLLNGGGMMHLVDAIARNSDIDYIHHHHEQCAGIAADAFARVKNQLGVCFATSGPGGTNLITSIAGAYQDSTPSLYIVGQSKVSETIANSKVAARQVGTFEINLIPIVKSICKYAISVTSSAQIPDVFQEAIETALSGRPGPCVIELPLDIQGSKISHDWPRPRYFQAPNISKVGPDEKISFFNKLKKDLERSRRPSLLVGKGIVIANKRTELLSFVKKHNLPVISTQFGKDSVNNYDDRFLGHSGPKGTRVGNFAIQKSDLIISLGCSLHGQTIGWEEDLFAPGAKFFRVDIDKNNLSIQKSFVDENLQVSITDFFAEMDALKINKDAMSWLTECRSFANKNQLELEPYSRLSNTINAYDVMFTINESLTDDEIFVSDAGTAFYVTGQALKLNDKQRFITSASLGAMGFAIPASTGAACAAPNKTVICITGDGSLMSNLSELSVAKNYNKKIIYIILNNNGYTSMRNTQDAFFDGRRIGEGPETGVAIPSLRQTATLFDIKFYQVREPKAFKTVLLEVKNIDGPVMIEVIANQNQEIIPTVKSRKLDNGKMISGTLHPMFPFERSNDE